MSVSKTRQWDDYGPFAGIWYFLITLMSLGLLAWVPFVHGAGRLRSRARTLQAIGYAAVDILALVLFFGAPVDAQDNPVGIGGTEIGIGVCALFGVMIVGCIQQDRMRRDIYGATAARHSKSLGAPTDPASRAVLNARAKRARARDILAKDPLMAHELRIGRPDLPHTYDDGGLVDLNAASAKAIAKFCELPPEVAHAIVEARTTTDGFMTVDDVFSVVDIPLSYWSRIRDRAMTITLTTP